MDSFFARAKKPSRHSIFNNGCRAMVPIQCEWSQQSDFTQFAPYDKDTNKGGLQIPFWIQETSCASAAVHGPPGRKLCHLVQSNCPKRPISCDWNKISSYEVQQDHLCHVQCMWIMCRLLCKPWRPPLLFVWWHGPSRLSLPRNWA